MIDLIVTEVQISPVKAQNGLVAFASCVINESIYVGNIGLYTSPTNPRGYRLVYPAKVLSEGSKISFVHPINRTAGELISAAIIGKYERIMEELK